jgi:acetyl-CoA C-acetyltransferase
VSVKQGLRRVAIVSACRTAVGGFGGSLKSVRAPQLAAVVMREAVSRIDSNTNNKGT